MLKLNIKITKTVIFYLVFVLSATYNILLIYHSVKIYVFTFKIQ